MLTSLFKHCRNLWLVSLMAFAVLGGQVLQASPLHDHARETVDCALCHLQTLGDDTEFERGLPRPARSANPVAPGLVAATPAAPFISPYQGRAPPVASD